jgi:hypothetical protein
MDAAERACPDCRDADGVSRRDFLRVAGAAAVAAGAGPLWGAETAASAGAPETLVKQLYDSLADKQKATVCFAWDHHDKTRGLLRSFVANNWQITQPHINSDFYTKDQQALIRQIFEGIIHPDWHGRIDKQLEDDAGGYGNDQSIAIFGRPGSEKFELVMTGRHMTLRCDGNSEPHVAFGGPIFYGHAAQGFNEKADHPGNVFWPQAVAANKVFQMLDGKQRAQALVPQRPAEEDVDFRGAGTLPGLSVGAMSSDQQALVQEVLTKLLEPYRQSDRDEVSACLKAQGGLEKCALAFYRDGDIGNDQVWDCWRLEGPALVWYFRGEPHVHVWVNVADNPAVKTNSKPYAQA